MWNSEVSSDVTTINGHVSHRHGGKGGDGMDAVHLRRFTGVEVSAEQLRRHGGADMGASGQWLGHSMVRARRSVPFQTASAI